MIVAKRSYIIEEKSKSRIELIIAMIFGIAGSQSDPVRWNINNFLADLFFFILLNL